MKDRDPLFAPPTMSEEIGMVRDCIREYRRNPSSNRAEDSQAIGFLVEEVHTQALSSEVLSNFLAREAASLHDHLDSLEYLGAH